MKIDYVSLHRKLYFKNWPNESSCFIEDPIIEETEINGIVKISGELVEIKNLKDEIHWAEFVCLPLDKYIDSYWPKKEVSVETSFFEKIKFLITTGKWITTKQVFEYQDSLVLKEKVEIFTKLNDFEIRYYKRS